MKMNEVHEITMLNPEMLKDFYDRGHAQSGVRHHAPPISHKQKRAVSLDEMPVTLNADEMAEVLHISRARAYQLLHRADFPTLKIGRRLLVTKEALCDWMRKNTRT